MMGHRSKRFKLFAETNLEALVPADNFYHQLEEKLDLSFVTWVTTWMSPCPTTAPVSRPSRPESTWRRYLPRTRLPKSLSSR